MSPPLALPNGTIGFPNILVPGPASEGDGKQIFVPDPSINDAGRDVILAPDPELDKGLLIFGRPGKVGSDITDGGIQAPGGFDGGFQPWPPTDLPPAGQPPYDDPLRGLPSYSMFAG
jgi:hypothetical protein